MSEIDPLLVAEDDADLWIGLLLRDIASAQRPDGTAYTELSFRYHVLALVHLLRGDERAFADLLVRSGRANVALRTAATQPGADVHPACLRASDALPFSDALVAGDLEAARAIARLAPVTHVESHEYEDDFLRFRFLHRLLLDPQDVASLEAILSRWDVVRRGAPCPYRDASEALLRRDAAALDDALVRMVDRRRDAFAAFRVATSYSAELDATEGQVFVHGLALARFAELLGLPVQDDLDFMPGLARIPLGGPTPSPHAWRIGSRV